MQRPTVTKESQPLQELVEALRIKKGRIQEGVFSWTSSNIARYPWRRVGNTPYEVIIGEILMERTTYAVANRVLGSDVNSGHQSLHATSNPA